MRRTLSAEAEAELPRTPRNARWPLRLAGLASMFALWFAASALLGPDVFPGPRATLEFLQREIERGTLWTHILITMWRVLASFGLALLIGVPLGWWLGVSRRAHEFAQSWLAVGLTVPRILILVVAYLLIGLNERAIITAITLILIPTVVVQMREGVRGLDERLHDMARAFRLPRLQLWWHVTLPQLLPSLLGTARVTLSLAWKMVVFGEVFGRTSGVGYMISFYFQQFEMRGILAYGLIMTVILSLLDLGLARLGDRAFRWKGDSA